jgi:hypothetical protein
MALKLGTTTASLYLGSTPVAAYLGAEQVYSAVQAVTLYFYYDPNDEEADFAWTTVGNWWLDAEHTEPAGRLPAAIDSVVVSTNVDVSGQTVVDFTITGGGLSGTLTVTGMATFSGGSGNVFGTINGDSTFNDSSSNLGTVTGNATFTGSACNSGTVDGSITGSPAACF